MEPRGSVTDSWARLGYGHHSPATNVPYSCREQVRVEQTGFKITLLSGAFNAESVGVPLIPAPASSQFHRDFGQFHSAAPCPRFSRYSSSSDAEAGRKLFSLDHAENSVLTASIRLRMCCFIWSDDRYADASGGLHRRFCFLALALALAVLALAAALEALVALFRLSSAVIALARARPPWRAKSERIFLISSCLSRTEIIHRASTAAQRKMLDIRTSAVRLLPQRC